MKVMSNWHPNMISPFLPCYLTFDLIVAGCSCSVFGLVSFAYLENEKICFLKAKHKNIKKNDQEVKSLKVKFE